MTSLANFYDSLYGDTIKRWPHETVVSFVERNHALLQRGIVLDDGCGAGRHCMYMARRGIRALGVDVSQVAIARAREWAAGERLCARFAVADSAALPQRDGSLAGLISWEAMYYGDESHVLRCLEEGLRVLAIGAPFLLLLKSTQDFRFARFERVSANACDSEQGLVMCCFERDEIDALLRPRASALAIESLAHSLHDGRDMVWNFVVTGRKEA